VYSSIRVTIELWGEENQSTMTPNRTIATLLAVSLGLAFSVPASADDAVISSASVQVKPGQMDAYLARVKSLQTVMKRLEAGGDVEAWQIMVGGPNTGTTFVVIEYPSLGSYAESTTKAQADAEFQKLMGGLDAVRTLQSTSLYRQVGGPASSGDVATGAVLQTISVQVEPGRLAEYLAKVQQLQAIAKRVDEANTMRVWQATAAGDATGTVVVGVIYKDLATFAASTTKLQADAEWQKLVAGLDDMRSVVSTGLARNVGP
jgi:hypothetical protein